MKKTQSFEGNIVKLILFANAVPTLLLLYFITQVSVSLYLKLMAGILVITILSYACFRVYTLIKHQIRTSTNLLEAIIVGDCSMRATSRINSGAFAEFNGVLNSISRVLETQKQTIKEQQLLFEKVIEQIDVAIITANDKGEIALINPSAERLFSCQHDEVIGKHIEQLGLQHILNKELQKVVEFELTQYRKKVYLHTDNYLVSGKPHTLIFITDIQRLLRDEERQAWQRLIRVLNHEINNSLAPITSISESLKRVCERTLPDNETRDDIQNGLSVIAERAQSLHGFIARYNQLSSLPPPSKSLVDLSEFLYSVTALYENVNWAFHGELSKQIFIDSEQMQQVLVNLIINAIEASTDKESHVFLSIFCKELNHKLVISLEDNGQGIANMDNLFIPFYSTKQNGNGIGLVLSRQIVMNHGGDLQIKNREGKQGAVASIYLPMS